MPEPSSLIERAETVAREMAPRHFNGEFERILASIPIFTPLQAQTAADAKRAEYVEHISEVLAAADKTKQWNRTVTRARPLRPRTKTDLCPAAVLSPPQREGPRDRWQACRGSLRVLRRADAARRNHPRLDP